MAQRLLIRMPMGTRTVSTAVLVSLALIGCSIVDVPGSRDYRKASDPASSSSSAACVAEPAKVEKVDLSTLAACECKAGGKAHCVSAAKLPESLATPLDVCDGTAGRCVPDAILESGETFRSCRASGSEGRCVTLCVPKVAQYAEVLTRGDGDSCESDERCVPCTMPDGSSSGICEVGASNACGADAGATPPPTTAGVTCPFTGTPMDVSKMPVCAPGGRCVSESLLEGVLTDPTKRTELEARLTSCATGYCVPEEYLKAYGQYKPPACKAFAGIEGRCFSTVFKDVAAQAQSLSRDTCAEAERCVPCFNPADGTPTGACSIVSCDSPTTAPPALESCCQLSGQPRGKCVPRSSVPAQLQSRLKADECDAQAELCIPTENIDTKATPTACTPTIGGPNGVCVSRCLVFSTSERLLLGTGNCDADHICAPCLNPSTGQPSGLPGCK